MVNLTKAAAVSLRGGIQAFLFTLVVFSASCSSGSPRETNSKSATDTDSERIRDSGAVADTAVPSRGSDAEQPSEAGRPPREAGTATEIGDLADANVAEPTCDGGSAVQLSYLTGGPGNVHSGSQVMWENGPQFFLITEACTFYAQVGQWGPVTTGRLETDELVNLVERLRLEELLQTPEYCTSNIGGLRQRIEYLERASTQRRCDDASVHELNSVFDEMIVVANELHQAGVPVDGPVRFSLLYRSENVAREDSFYVDGQAWPVGDPHQFANPAESEDVLVVDVHTTDGAGATALRELRERAVAIDPLRQFIPIVEPDGSRFQLFLRDSLPQYEGDNGRLLP